jgi:hypothetical protein
MIDIESFAPELYGFWPQKRVYDGDPAKGLDAAEARAMRSRNIFSKPSQAPRRRPKSSGCC